MRVFITGVSQGIGEALARDLIAGGHEVLGVSRSRPDNQQVRWVSADVTSATSIAEACVSLGLDQNPCDAVVCSAQDGIACLGFELTVVLDFIESFPFSHLGNFWMVDVRHHPSWKTLF